LRRAEESAELSAELQRSNKELEAFSYSVSHDLRAPFRHIVGYAELLLASSTATLSDGDRRYIDVIIDSAHYAGTLVDNLLSFSQMGRAKLNIRRIAMGPLVADVRRDLLNGVRDRRVVWEIARLPEVHADPLMLRLVLQNLLENALKYSRKRAEAVIEVGWQSEEREDVFYVRDNGVGFEQAYAGKLFGMFQRLHKVEEFEGTGIGLANVRALIARHGGRTWAEGELDRGATFYFSIPKKHDLEAQNAETDCSSRR
jgi:chemotaxis family two-component system sensor kinase Cph1